MTLTLSELITVMSVVFGASVALIMALWKWGRASDRAKIKQMLETAKAENAQALNEHQNLVRMDLAATRAEMTSELEKFQLVLGQIATDRESCSGRHASQVREIKDQAEKMRDKWEQFIRDDAAMEATRGRKVEALFGVVDSIKENVRGLPVAMSTKMDEMFRAAREELRSDARKYVRDQLREQNAEA